MKLTVFLATTLIFSAIAEEPVNWQIAGAKPLVLQGWGTVRDIYGLARFSQKSNSLSVELAGGGADFGYAEKVAPSALSEVEGDFEVSVTLQPGMVPDGGIATSNRVLWNGAGLLVEADDGNFVRLEVTVRQPAGKKMDNRIWANHAIRKTGTWDQPELKGWDPKKPMFLRIQRTGAQFKWGYSYDKEKWTELKPFEAKGWPAKLKVGVLFVNLTTKVQKATVSDLKIVRVPADQRVNP